MMESPNQSQKNANGSCSAELQSRRSCSTLPNRQALSDSRRVPVSGGPDV